MPLDPLAEARRWYEEALVAEVPEANAMALATADLEGRPCVRYLLFKSFDERGVSFHTNYGSRKGRELDANPRAAVAIFWQPLGRQVRMEGRVERSTPEESDAYFATRPRERRIGAWASRQGSVLPSREALDEPRARAERAVRRRRDPAPGVVGRLPAAPRRGRAVGARHRAPA